MESEDREFNLNRLIDGQWPLFLENSVVAPGWPQYHLHPFSCQVNKMVYERIKFGLRPMTAPLAMTSYITLCKKTIADLSPPVKCSHGLNWRSTSHQSVLSERAEAHHCPSRQERMNVGKNAKWKISSRSVMQCFVAREECAMKSLCALIGQSTLFGVVIRRSFFVIRFHDPFQSSCVRNWKSGGEVLKQFGQM